MSQFTSNLGTLTESAEGPRKPTVVSKKATQETMKKKERREN